jgi:hypothetical protein
MKFNLNWNERKTAGLIIAIVSPLVFIPLTLLILSFVYGYPYKYMWNQLMYSAIAQGKYLSLSIIPNLLWFYICLNKERYDLVRGIIIGTALYVPLILYFNFIK